jgi:hypothetical protein
MPSTTAVGVKVMVTEPQAPPSFVVVQPVPFQ